MTNDDASFKPSRQRLVFGWILILLAILIWLPASDVVDLVIRQKEVLLGRYSQGHFGSLCILTVLLLGAGTLCFSRLRSFGEMLGVALMVTISSVVSGFVLVVASGWIAKPRYIEEIVTQKHNGIEIAGLVRHRSPSETFHLVQDDIPEQHRSYPDAPPGYPKFELTLTTDKYGFRNQSNLAQYPLLAVGDSYVAGSHVSDQQAWVSLVSRQLGQPIYNLGVSGSDPGIYLNNFVLLGRQFKPKLVLFMLYEGNDFKDITPPVFSSMAKNPVESTASDKKQKSLYERIQYLVDASPVKSGLNRFSSEYLEKINSDGPVPDYQKQVGWMPLKVTAAGKTHYYGFEPKRLIYLYEEKESFRKSASWQAVARIMQQMVELGHQDGFNVIFLYAPSTPHVVMPLVEGQIPADQLRNFVAFQKKDLPEADVFKRNVFAWMNNEEDVFMETCRANGWACSSLTKPLRDATARGEQVYYSYDQHWTPEGNRVASEHIVNYLLMSGSWK